MRIFGLNGEELQFNDPLGIASEQIGLGLEPEKSTQVSPATEVAQNVRTSEPLPAADTVQQTPTRDLGIPAGVSEQDWNDAVNTLIAEGAGEGETGMIGVANVIHNRSLKRNMSIGEVVRQPSQFEGYENPRHGSRKAMQDPATRQKAEAILRGVLTGEVKDNTGGADHFHANYVNPSWNRSMPRTATIGNHLFYNSKPTRPDQYAQPVSRAGGDVEEPFKAVMPELRDQASDESTSGASDTKVPNPEARGLARLVSVPDAPKNSSGGNLHFVHKGQERLNPTFASILRDSSKALGRDFVINSGFRPATHAVERRKQQPGQHTRGSASDISLKGMSPAERQAVVLDLMARGVKRFGTYTNHPDMLHVDMLDMHGGGKSHFMHNTTAQQLGRAPAWFREISDGKLTARMASNGNPSLENAIVVGSDYKPANDLGLLGDDKDPFNSEIAAQQERHAAVAQQVQLDEQQRQLEAENAAVAQKVAEGNKESPNRYIAIDEREVDAYQRNWNEENKSGGLWGDVGRILTSGNAQLGLGARELVRMIPSVGESVVNGLDAIDEWVTGSNPQQRMSEAQERANASVSDQQGIADQKSWWNAEEGKLGDAWMDPRSYMRGVVESLPAMAVSMGASGLLARGAYMGALANGATQRAAAAAAARTATIAGGLSEGLLAAGDASLSIGERISKMPREQLLESTAIKSLVDGGMTPDEAIAAVTNDAQTQAMLVSGVLTGIFGGFGDRALAKIITEGVGGTFRQRVMGGAARGIVGEGLLEEVPQNVGQTLSENLAINTHIDPRQELTEGLGEAIAGGAAVGGAMGGGMGAAGGAMRPKGPLKRAEQAGAERRRRQEQQSAEESAVSEGMSHEPQYGGPVDGTTYVKVEDIPGLDGYKPKVGTTVRIDAEGMEPFMGTVESYDGDDAIILDQNTGEYLQVPIANLTPIAPPMDEYDAPRRGQEGRNDESAADPLPDISNDPALEPLAPTVEPVKTEAAPATEDMPLDERIKRPKTGERITVSDANIGRFHAKIISYEEGGREALVVDDDGNEFQVPSYSLRVSRLTDSEIEAEELRRNPPIERELGDAGENSRRIGKSTIVLPDPDHAALYDLGREQAFSKRMFGTSFVDMGKVMPVERKRLAEAFGVDVKQLASMADNYRYHAERAARDAKSNLPVKLFALDRREMKKRQAEHAAELAGPDAAPIEATPDTWWDVELNGLERKKLLDGLGIKRSEKSAWGAFTPNIQKRILAYRDTLKMVDGFNRPQQGENETNNGDAQTNAVDVAGGRIAGNESNDRPSDGDTQSAIEFTGEQSSTDASQASQATNRSEAEEPRIEPANQKPAKRTALDDAAHQAATSPENDAPEPTQAQKEAGNYKVGHIRLGGMELSIENPAGSERKGVSRSGKPWAITMKSHYGYIRGTEGKDKDHIDVFVKPGTEQLADDAPVFIVDQKDPAKGQFDEHKVMVGYSTMDEAKAAYMENYTANWKGMGDISQVTLAGFKDWLANGDTKSPYAPKWFGTRDKAEAYIEKKKLGDTHSVVENGKRFEIRKNEPEATTAERKPLPNATAPEHVQVGVDDRELAQIVEEFNAAQQAMIEDGEPVSYVLHPPKKNEIVRLQDKVNKFLKMNDDMFLTPEEAKENIEGWKARVRAQGKDYAIRSENSKKVVLSLFDLTGKWSEPWVEAGYKVHRFDIQSDPELGDVNKFSIDYFNDWFGSFDGDDIYAILAACPCTDFAASGARHFAAKDADGRTVASVELVHQTLRTIEYFKPQIWAIENPVGRIEKLGGLQPWRLSFDPNHIGEDYTKKTLLWGRFNADLPIAPVYPSEGSKMHRLYGGKSQATKNARSATPEGFAYAFFMANNAHDHPVMDIANKYDRLDRSVIEEAVKVGIKHDDISEVVDDFYYQEMEDEAANDAIRELIDERKAEEADLEAKQEAYAREVGDKNALEVDVKDDNEPRRKRTAEDIYEELTDKISVKQFIELAMLKPANHVAVVITPDGKLRELKPSSNPDGDHTEFFTTLHELIGDDFDRRGYVSIRAVRNSVGVTPASPVSPQTATLIGAIERAAQRAGMQVEVDPYRIEPTVKQQDAPNDAAQEPANQKSASEPKVTYLNDDFGNWSVPQGTVLNSKNGNELAPFPKFSTETPRERKASLKRFYQWLIDQAIAEAGRIMKANPSERPTMQRFERMKADNLPPVEFGELNDYLFGDRYGPNDSHIVGNQVPTPTETRPSKPKKQPAQSKAPKTVAPNAPGIDLWRGASAAEVAAIKAGTFEFRPDQLGIMFTTDRETASEFARQNRGERIAVKIPTDAKILDRKGLTDMSREYRELVEASALRPEYGTVTYHELLRAEAREREFDVVTYSSGTGDYLVYEVLNPDILQVVEDAAPADKQSQRKPTSEAKKVVVSENKFFTANAAEKARALLKKKLSGNTLNSGIDPEIMQAGITLAGYHIEKGARTFAAYAKAMLADLGGDVRPFLKSWYMGVKYDPRAAGFDGMSSAAEVENADVNAITVDSDEPEQLETDGREALEGVSAEPVQSTESGGDVGARTPASSRGDVSGGRPAGAGRVSARRSVSDGQGDLLASATGEPNASTSERDQQRTDGRSEPRSKDSRNSVKAVEPKRSVDAVPDVALNVVPAQQLPTNHVIADSDVLAERGQKTKFKNNVAAIEVLRKLDAESRPATREEQNALAKWVGWGGLVSAFYREDGTANKGWEKEAAQLKALLTPEEYRAAESSTRNAHYTSKEIVNAAWSIAERLGFSGGRVLEPSVGSGNFLGLMPANLRGNVSITGVELDHITGNIAKNLYPKANIQAPVGFEALSVPNDYFDLAIGNPPFGAEKLYDANRRHLNKLSIHNFFFAKSIETLAPNGLLAMVVTNRFLDGRNDSARSMIAKQADLVGAIRLPNNAFLQNAGTEVTTDIVILQKRPEGQEAKDLSWLAVDEHKDKNGKSVPLNRYFVNNPDMMLGEFGAYGSMYGPDEPALVARAGQDTPQLLVKAVDRLPKDIAKRDGGPVVDEPITVAENVESVEVGSVFLSPDGDIHERLDDHIGQRVSQKVEFDSPAAKARVSGMIRIRDAFAKLRKAQINKDSTEAQLQNLRERLNTHYDAFVEAHGHINADANKRLFRDDPTWPQISALEEKYDRGVSAAVSKSTGEAQRPASAKKAAVFSKRTQHPYVKLEKVSTAKDALAVSMNEYGRLNFPAMEALYGKSKDGIVEELGDLIYETPDGNFETQDAYLSGNVRQKLAEAERAQEAGGNFERNIRALQAVVPADIEAVDIDVKPGAPWVPANYVAEFSQHILGSRNVPKASYLPEGALWRIEADRASQAAETQWGTEDRRPVDLLNAVFNMKSVTVSRKNRDGSTTVDQAATDAANEKIERIKSEWRNWIWQDDDRREALSRIYNDTYNATVLQTFDGSHLTLPGKVGDEIIELRPSQKNFIWRTLQTGTALADHTVGAGKTFAAIASIMEKRRIGQARKPMLVVPNHLVGQWAADFIKLYPGAKVLAATKRDFEKANRKRLFARIATGDWDVVIVAHSQYGLIGIDPEYQARFIREEVEQLEASIATLKREEGDKSRNAKQLSSWRDNLTKKLQKLMDGGRKDDGLTFDELGVDALYLDEAHEFKNLAVPTSMTRIAGLGKIDGNQKTADMYVKIRYILEQTNGNNVVFLTGTPVSNTMAEMFTMMRYLAGDKLKQMGISHFDAWAKVFGEVVTDWELSPAGKYKLTKRFSKFVNVPELMGVYRSFADVITNADIKAQLAAQGKKFPLPKVKGGKPQNIVVERSDAQAAFIGVEMIDENGSSYYSTSSLIYRSEHLPKGKAEKGADNMLKISGEARKAALDMRLIDPSSPDVPGSKVHRAADEMVRIYKQWDAEKGTQLVFCDLSIPQKAAAKEAQRIRDLIEKAENGDEDAAQKLDEMSPDDFLALDAKFSVYDDLRQKLIDRGIPEKEIAFIHDANTDLQKEALFAKVRSGQIRFLFGSTAKMGAGTNVQNRLVALHHMDAPWRPSDLEQRDGRGIRQGNELYDKDPEGFEIEILRYATKNTLDARQWEMLEKKATFIEQLRRGAVNTRDVEDVAGEAANSAEMKAAASGNPLILEEMDTRRKLKQLQSQATEFEREQFRVRNRIKGNERRLEELQSEEGTTRADAELSLAVPDEFSATVDGVTYDKLKDFGTAILSAIKQNMIDGKGERAMGDYAGFGLSSRPHRASNRSYFVVISNKGEYTVLIEDPLDADATGVARRVVNLVKQIAKKPEAARQERAELTKQSAALEKQVVSEWPGKAELEAVEAKHRRLIDILKPSQKAPAGAANPVVVQNESAAKNEYDQPEHKVFNDPVTPSGLNDLRSLPIPKKPAEADLHHWAVGVIKSQMHTGHEYLIAIEADGTVFDYGTAGKVNDTGMNDRLANAMANPQRRLVVYHNHPSNTPLSAPDFAALLHAGVFSVWAIGHKGQLTRATVKPHFERVLNVAPSRAALSNALQNAINLGRRNVTKKLESLRNSGAISQEDAEKAWSFIATYLARESGLFDVWVKDDYNYENLPDFASELDDLARTIRQGFYENQQKSGSELVRRPATEFRHIADVAGVVENGIKPINRRSTTSGLGEGSPLGSGKKAYRTAQKQQPKEELKLSREAVLERTIEEVRGTLTDVQPAILKAIPLNYFTELAPSNMTAVNDYMRVKRQMDAYRGEKHAKADETAQEWLKFTRLGFMGKDKAKAQELAELMHDSTLAGIDPTDMSEENAVKGGFEQLRKRYMALSPAAKKLYQRVRDAYASQSRELDEILIDNVRKAFEIAQRQAEARYRKTLESIKDSGLTGLDLKKAEEDAASAYKAATTKTNWAAKARMTKLRIMFESSRVPAPYFPLGRFGRYFISVRDVDGTILSFSKYEDAASRNREAKELEKQYPHAKIEKGVMDNRNDVRGAMDPRMLAEIEEVLGGSNLPAELMDQIWQRYLETMPDLSARKRFIHRKGTAGYSQDAMRVFSSHMFHAAHQMARLKYGMELEENVNVAHDQAKEADDPTAAVTLANELGSRHKWVMNPTGGKAAQTVTTAAFIWYLAASPAAALVNMTQTVMLGLPILGARFGGIVKAGKALAAASVDSVAGKGSVLNGKLTDQEKKAVEAFYRSGMIDRTQSHDLAGVGETGVEYSPLRAKIMEKISWAFHRAEVWNREVTALAAYRLAVANGADHSQAIDTAHDLTWKTHFDYSNSSRPALMQNDFAKVALVFRQHNINMLYRVMRDVHQSIKGETEQMRREARYQLAGVMGMMVTMAGVTGTMGFNLVMMALGMAFDDEDDPFDFDAKFKASVVDVLGPQLGGMLLNGVPGHMLGIDLSARIGMPDLWFRSPSRELQGKDEYQYWLSQALGATAGLGEQLFTGFRTITGEGDVARGIEMMAPKAIRDLMKSYRYANEGITAKNNDEIMSSDDISAVNILAQAIGFTPAKISQMWERSGALKGAEQRVNQRRQTLINTWAFAAQKGDKAAMDAAINEIRQFNSVKIHANSRITGATLKRSLKTRAVNAAKRSEGALIRNVGLGTELRDQLGDKVY